ncbi:VacJ family lipoprotein [Aliivibrio fischeri]|uniref:MlaA family lipoprotein n=1 Tax=Aliivibrio fischeri TaxID=668 RepID=UPI001324AF13|nr:VacJ family lipoprotein [Aliivibrio fischeri]MUK73164.1 VacJ family lipoprotein [Aliivibrio fischeri]
MKRIWTSCCILLFVSACSQTPEQTEEELGTIQQVDTEYDESHTGDPLEGFNRVMWGLNYDYLDPYLVRPVSISYVEYTPTPIRYGIANFLANLDEPSSMINNLLMGNGNMVMVHFNRFWLNTTLGLVGLIDIASAADIQKPDSKSFGDALGHYGVGNGPYFMLPGYGPWTLREAGDFVDGLYMPLSYLNFWQGLGKWGLEGMESRVQLISQEPMLEASPDPYVLTRDVYLQRQDFKAEIEPEVDLDAEDDIDDYLDEIDE